MAKLFNILLRNMLLSDRVINPPKKCQIVFQQLNRTDCEVNCTLGLIKYLESKSESE